MAALGGYLDAAARAARAENGAALAQLLSVNSAEATLAVAEAMRSNRHLNLGSLCQQKVPEPFDHVFASHCQCLGALGEGRYEAGLDASPLLSPAQADTASAAAEAAVMSLKSAQHLEDAQVELSHSRATGPSEVEQALRRGGLYGDGRHSARVREGHQAGPYTAAQPQSFCP
jgi:hypothetical protein